MQEARDRRGAPKLPALLIGIAEARAATTPDDNFPAILLAKGQGAQMNMR